MRPVGSVFCQPGLHNHTQEADMNPTEQGRDRAGEAQGQGAEEEVPQWHWRRPARSDQAPGEETVQVNDQYVGGDRSPRAEAPQSSDQHQTGG
jgi:hypothetical protein